MALKNDEFIEYLKDIFSNIDGITFRSMFGGHAIYKNGVTFAIVAYGTLYFRVDDSNRRDFEDQNCQPFTYETKHGPRVMKSHLELPSAVLEDENELPLWVEKSYKASLKVKALKNKSKK